MDVWLIVSLVGAAICAVLAIRATRLLVAAIWLAGVSALISAALYMLGAQMIAVIELSVGAGLVTVLFVFAISIAGEDALELTTLVPRPLAIGLVVVAVGLVVWMVVPQMASQAATAAEGTFSETLWNDRGLDVLVQIVVIFSGVIGILGLLGENDNVPRAMADEKQLEDSNAPKEPQS